MGSGGSKTCRDSSSASASASGSGGRRKTRSRSHWNLPSSCLSSNSASNDSDDDVQVCSRWMRKSHRSISRRRRRRTALEPMDSQENADCYEECKDHMNAEDDKCCISSDELELDECGEESVTNVPSRNGSYSQASSSSRSLSTPGRIFSHFRFISGNLSSRLSRASSSRSMNAYPVSSSHGTTANDLEGVTSISESISNFIDRNESRRGNDMNPTSHYGRSCIRGFEASNGSSPSHYSTYHVSDEYQHEHRVPMVDNVIRDFGATRVIEDTDSNYTGVLDRRPMVQGPFERNVRFSRTLSVGRLRDRVLRRSSLTDFTYRPSQQQGGDSDTTSLGGGLIPGSQTTTSVAESSPVTSTTILRRSPSSSHRSLFGIQDHEMQTPRVREGRYQDLWENRSNFLERRRRIRSQVRALQRLGSRFENVSGHDRSCALAGQNQTGRCTCRATNRGASTTDETNARASISRIVMLAEALFEVLDEIHQQSVVLSSQPSVSPIGSVPAPNDIVDLLPVKLYNKSHKERNDEASQCYICLLEYEEGDTIRTLPCHHEFHRTCVDKWLKEIHRVCPLCRGDICKPGLSPERNL